EINNLYTQNTTNYDLILHNGALRKDLRGFGVCNFLVHDIFCLATQKKSNRIFGATWEKNTHALKTFKHYNAQQDVVLDFRHTIFKDQLINLVCHISILEDKLKTYKH
nr:hypothetical protein [Burkholderiales bacterium]